jgi:hypothetical protein
MAQARLGARLAMSRVDWRVGDVIGNVVQRRRQLEDCEAASSLLQVVESVRTLPVVDAAIHGHEPFQGSVPVESGVI